MEARWVRLKKELDTIKARNQECLLVGDLNKWVGNDNLGVKGNHDNVSVGEHLVLIFSYALWAIHTEFVD